MESSQYSTQGQFDGYGVTSTNNESTSYQVFPQEQYQFNRQFDGYSVSSSNNESTSYQVFPQEQYQFNGQFDGYGVTSSNNESTSYQVFPQEQFQFNSNLSSTETTGSSYQYTSQGYGYGYWNGYGIPNSNEGTPYYSSTEPKDEESEIRALLEYLESLYFESQDLFKKVFPELLEKYKGKKGSKEDKAKAKSFTKVLKKLAMKLHKKKLGQLNVQTMRRSLSLGSPHTPTPGIGGGSSFKLEWFRIKTGHGGGGGVDTRHGGQGTNRFV